MENVLEPSTPDFYFDAFRSSTFGDAGIEFKAKHIAPDEG
jgi:hypothetical protein